MKATKPQIKRFHSLLNSLKLSRQKLSLLEGYGVGSTSDLEEEQIDKLITYLEKQKSTKNLKDYQFATFNSGNRQHMNILSLAIQYGWRIYSDQYKRYIADLNKLGAWIRKSSKCKKPLSQQTSLELQDTIHALTQMLKKHLK